LSCRLAGKGDVALTADNVRAIVRALVQLGAVQTQAEAVELLRLAGMQRVQAREWKQGAPSGAPCFFNP